MLEDHLTSELKPLSCNSTFHLILHMVALKFENEESSDILKVYAGFLITPSHRHLQYRGMIIGNKLLEFLALFQILWKVIQVFQRHAQA